MDATRTKSASFAEEIARGIQEVLDYGHLVPSVQGHLSKASNFGTGDRPWIELVGHLSVCRNDQPSIPTSDLMRTHVPYVLGLLAWTLDGRSDVQTLAYYRAGAVDFSDDGATLCGAFGARIRSRLAEGDQAEAVLGRMKEDPTSRRTFIPIIESTDNISEGREYPCAAGIQLFQRDGALHWLTVMRAQQALTVAPYDFALFGLLHHFYASFLNLEVGTYRHFAGTHHIYESERDLAQQVLNSGMSEIRLPAIPRAKGAAIKNELVEAEVAIRSAATDGRIEHLSEHYRLHPPSFEFVRVSAEILLDFARDWQAKNR